MLVVLLSEPIQNVHKSVLRMKKHFYKNKKMPLHALLTLRSVARMRHDALRKISRA
jgi:hypothetical protein